MAKVDTATPVGVPKGIQTLEGIDEHIGAHVKLVNRCFLVVVGVKRIIGMRWPTVAYYYAHVPDVLTINGVRASWLRQFTKDAPAGCGLHAWWVKCRGGTIVPVPATISAAPPPPPPPPPLMGARTSTASSCLLAAGPVPPPPPSPKAT